MAAPFSSVVMRGENWLADSDAAIDPDCTPIASEPVCVASGVAKLGKSGELRRHACASLATVDCVKNCRSSASDRELSNCELCVWLSEEPTVWVVVMELRWQAALLAL